MQRERRTAASAGPRWQLVCMAASANTWLLFVLVVVSVPLIPILVQASVGWCTTCLRCLHGLVCLYQIKLNNVKQSSNKAQNKAQNQGRGARGSPRAGPPMEKEGGVRSARSGKDLHACPHTTQRLTGLNCLPLCVAVLGAPHVICDHAAMSQRLHWQWHMYCCCFMQSESRLSGGSLGCMQPGQSILP